MLTVLATGPLTTVQDRGRPGWAAIGVTRSGAADADAAALANRLVGNQADAAVLEATAGGLRLRAERFLLVAVTGAPVPVAFDGRPAPFAAPTTLRPGAVLALGTPPRGLRSYLAVRGGIDVPPVLGSRSTDTLSGLGPAPLAVGDRLPVGAVSGAEPVVDVAPVGGPAEHPVLRVLPGPRADWLAPGAWTALTSSAWRVGQDSDRVGLRLSGPVLPRERTGELPSEGLVPGAVQVPPDGAPVLFLADHPVTGGYPVLAVVRTADLPAAGQLRPGDVVRFRG
ncbi:biotin-dependent carboxyltransferase family protein [Blastococcus sp. TF02A-30]|uniref:5-oxoprolinase subunit C family protein n=1 Tax=Blastococcus sp. TF02A-30 TaxID=2250580 RepID=UPI000DE9251A|nr:biotin-dependent carboxyltransferase family protein [Blastococcus sp. TF02A-30]RBY89431.1 allophanate hydrolase subunit 2 family protein [Blastococcus sp. TF02A-30]